MKPTCLFVAKRSCSEPRVAVSPPPDAYLQPNSPFLIMVHLTAPRPPFRVVMMQVPGQPDPLLTPLGALNPRHVSPRLAVILFGHFKNSGKFWQLRPAWPQKWKIIRVIPWPIALAAKKPQETKQIIINAKPLLLTTRQK